MKFLFFIMIVVFFYCSSFGQAGVLDSSFSDDGIITKFPGGYGSTVAIQSDGKIVVGGYDGTEGFSVIRINTDGSLDNTFGGDGFSKTTVGLGYNQHAELALQDDGKIVIGGTCAGLDGYWHGGLARFNTDGSLDNSFNGGSVVYAFNEPQSHANTAQDVVITPDQKIVTVGSTSTMGNNSVFATARFNSNGTFDNSFGINGVVLTAVGNKYAESLGAAVQQDGKIVVAGNSCVAGAPCSFALVRYNIDGSLDNTFGTGGMDTLYFGAGGVIGTAYNYDVAYAVAIQEDGKIILTGVSFLGTDSFYTIPIARYLPDGTLDMSFGISGKTRISFPSYKYPYGYSIALQQDNKIVITGECSNAANQLSIFFVLRTLENGALDNSFGINGITYTAVDTTHSSYNMGNAVAIDAAQKIVVAGQSYQGITVLKYLSGLNVGIFEMNSSNNPLLVYPNPIYSQATIEYELKLDDCLTISLFDPQGKIVQTFFTHQNRVKGKYKEELHFNSTLPPGNYILSLSNEKSKQHIKIILLF